MNKPPIKDIKEAQRVFDALVKTTMQTVKISKEQAEKRITALIASGVLDNGDPDTPLFQMIVDKFLNTQID